MKANDVFDIKRLVNLIVNELRFHTKTILIFAVALFVFFLIMPFEVTNSPSVYLAILYIGGFIISSFAFKDLHNPQKAYFSLMLPCSNLEYFLSKWFLTSIGYAIILLAIYYLCLLLHFAMLLSWVNMGAFHHHIYPMDVFQSSLWISMGKYIILQSVVLLGAIVFKKYALIKTALVLGCYFLLLNLFLGLIFYLFFPHDWTTLSASYLSIKGGYFILWLFSAPVFWYTTYLKLTEFELK